MNMTHNLNFYHKYTIERQNTLMQYVLYSIFVYSGHPTYLKRAIYPDRRPWYPHGHRWLSRHLRASRIAIDPQHPARVDAADTTRR